MRVDVIRLRAAGEKLSAKTVEDTEPTRGELTIAVEPWRPTWAPSSPYEPTRFAKLQAPGAA